MNYLIWTVSLLGILSTAVFCARTCFLDCRPPRFRLASTSVGRKSWIYPSLR